MCHDQNNVNKIVANFGLMNLGLIFAAKNICLDGVPRNQDDYSDIDQLRKN